MLVIEKNLRVFLKFNVVVGEGREWVITNKTRNFLVKYQLASSPNTPNLWKFVKMHLNGDADIFAYVFSIEQVHRIIFHNSLLLSIQCSGMHLLRIKPHMNCHI